VQFLQFCDATTLGTNVHVAAPIRPAVESSRDAAKKRAREQIECPLALIVSLRLNPELKVKQFDLNCWSPRESDGLDELGVGLDLHEAVELAIDSEL
jgi:hypothetical protein